MGNTCCAEDHEGREMHSNLERTKSIKPKKASNKKGAAVMETDDTMIEENGVTEYIYWDEPRDLSDDGIRDQDSFDVDGVSLMRKGRTYPMFNTKITKEIPAKLSKKAAKMYRKLGTFRLRPHELVDARLDGVTLQPGVIMQDQEGAYYVGEVDLDENRHGRGIAIYNDGSVYEGFFRDNQRNGAGRMIFKNGDVYQGFWSNGLCKGYGIYDSLNKTDFKGFWRNGSMNGDGFEIIYNEYTYRGQFSLGEKSGHGEIKWNNGDKYVGDFKYDSMYGIGTFYWANGDKYEGEFERNNMHGEGVFTHADGTVEEGIFEEGKNIKVIQKNSPFDYLAIISFDIAKEKS